MSTCPRCGAENYINTCVDCGFEQTRDVLSYYTLTRLSDEDLSFFDTEERLIRQCAKQLKALNSFICRRGSARTEVDERLAALWDEYAERFKPEPSEDAASINSEELYKRGLDFFHGKENEKPSYDKALELFTAAAAAGNDSAMYLLGNMYANGKGVEQDYSKAMDWYRKAANYFNASAMCQIGYMYENAQGVAPSFKSAMEWYERAANNGSVTAMYNLGVKYRLGRGTEANYALALKWYLKAAEKGDVAAMNALGNMYFNGQAVGRDIKKAVEWFEKAANGGNPSAMKNLSYIYKEGKGIERDLQKAEEWRKKAEAARS